MSIPYLAGKSTHTHSPLGICQALASTCALSHVIPNLWAPTAFYGVIKADNDWFLFDQICCEKLEKYSRQFTRFPLGAIENLVEGTEGFTLGVTRDPQARRYGSLARCQQSAHRQNARMPPGWLREDGTERVQSLIEKLWNGLTEFGGKINMFHDCKILAHLSKESWALEQGILGT